LVAARGRCGTDKADIFTRGKFRSWRLEADGFMSIAVDWFRNLIMDAAAALKVRQPINPPDPPWLAELSPEQQAWRRQQLRRGRNPDKFLSHARKGPDG
jgi:hypothetical protein